jgi:hypothetical protein
MVLKGYKVNGGVGGGAGIFVQTDFFFGKNQISINSRRGAKIK